MPRPPSAAHPWRDGHRDWWAAHPEAAARLESVAQEIRMQEGRKDAEAASVEVTAPRPILLLHCRSCGRNLPDEAFHRHRDIPSRRDRQAICKYCRRTNDRTARQQKAQKEGRAWLEVNHQVLPERRHCVGCRQDLPIRDFGRIQHRRKARTGGYRTYEEYRSRCRECRRQQEGLYRRRATMRKLGITNRERSA